MARTYAAESSASAHTGPSAEVAIAVGANQARIAIQRSVDAQTLEKLGLRALLYGTGFCLNML